MGFESIIAQVLGLFTQLFSQFAELFSAIPFIGDLFGGLVG